MIADCLREGATLADVRQQLAAQTAPALPNRVKRQAATLDELEAAAVERFASQRCGLYGEGS